MEESEVPEIEPENVKLPLGETLEEVADNMRLILEATEYQGEDSLGIVLPREEVRQLIKLIKERGKL